MMNEKKEVLPYMRGDWEVTDTGGWVRPSDPDEFKRYTATDRKIRKIAILIAFTYIAILIIVVVAGSYI